MEKYDIFIILLSILNSIKNEDKIIGTHRTAIIRFHLALFLALSAKTSKTIVKYCKPNEASHSQ